MNDARDPANRDGLKYDIELSPNSTYARAARLIAATEPPTDGIVVDVGAGVGTLGQAVAQHELGYVGFDVEPASVDEMRRRGFAAHELDMNAAGASALVLETIAELDGRVVAVCALDIIEHLPNPDASVRLLAEIVDAIAARQDGAAPIVVVSIPNVAHADIAMNLIAGRWEVTELGLLDRTHLSLFDEQRFTDTFIGPFTEIASDDVLMEYTEQRSRPDDPVFAQAGLGQYLRYVRNRSPHADTYQFVRALQRNPTQMPAAPTVVDESAPFLTVIMRSQGDRMTLVDALTSLAAQTDRDIEVNLMVHVGDDEEGHAVVAGIAALVDTFDDDFVQLVNVHHVVGGGRSAPLNAGLDAARGRYVAILDDDDVVLTNWVAVFRSLAERHPGALVRAQCVVQTVERRDTALLDFEVVSGFESPYPAHTDLLDIIRSNRTPPCSFAAPMEAVRSFGFAFDDTLRVCEDWKFQLDVGRVAGYAPDAAVTSVYRRWRGGGGSESAEAREHWITDHERVVDDLDTDPTVIPPGSLRRIHDLYTRIEQLERELGRRGDDDPPLRFTD